MTEERETLWERCTDLPAQDRRNQLRMLWTLLAWAVSFVGATFLIKRGLLPPGPASWLVAALPWALGVVALIVYVRFLRETDELQRLIQLRALALGFGGTYFTIAGYRVLEQLGAPPADLNDVSLVMIFYYVIAILFGWRRYR